MSIKARLLAGTTLLVALVIGLSAISAQGQGEAVTFDVGDPNGIDSMSPLVGVTAAAYEAWNIQYATLTDKAA